MTEIEKVKKGLSLCLSGVVSACIGCPYDAECKEARGTDQSPLLRDALKLLKEQEMVVRCIDCKHHRENNCEVQIGVYDPNWFCADGERVSK